MSHVSCAQPATASRTARTPTRILLETVVRGDEFRSVMAELVADSKRRLVAMSQDQAFMSQLRFALTVRTRPEVVQYLVERVHGLSVRHATLLVEEALGEARA
jgi:hypothetical protein